MDSIVSTSATEHASTVTAPRSTSGESSTDDRARELAVTPPRVFRLAHPGWVSYSNLSDACAAVSKVAYAQREKILNKLLACIRGANQPEFRLRAIAELADPCYYAALHAEGAPTVVTDAMACLAQLSREELTATAYSQAMARLQFAQEHLTRALTNRTVKESAGFTAAERRALTPLVQGRTSPGLVAKADRAMAREKVRREAESRNKLRLAETRRLEADKRAVAQRALMAVFAQGGLSASAVPANMASIMNDASICAKFLNAFETKLTAESLRDAIGLRASAYRALVTQCRVFADAAKAKKTSELQESRKREAHAQQREAALVPEGEMPARLGITTDEYREWRDAGRLPVSALRKAPPGRSAKPTALHHPDDFAQASKKQIAAWRKDDLTKLSASDQALRKQAVDKAKTALFLAEQLTRVARDLDCEVAPASDGLAQTVPGLGAPAVLGWTKRVELQVEVCAPGMPVQVWPVRTTMESTHPVPATLAQAKKLFANVETDFSVSAQKGLARRIAEGVLDTLGHYSGALTNAQCSDLLKGLRGVISRGVTQREAEHSEFAKRLVSGPVRATLEHIEAQRAQTLLNLQDFPQAFALARSLERKIYLTLGPTNSGKTHRALEALKAAKSGLYLAPLRLLAMELRDRLVAAGVPCNLMTGEEHDMMEGARHTACTIEMMNPTHEVDVAVIDEIQMLEDPHRGWAWTAALVGAPAHEVYVCGALNVEKPCLDVLRSLNEDITVDRLKRLTPLFVESRSMAGDGKSNELRKNLAKGDAVVAFSRKDVLTLSARIREWGFSVATIYGALAPEVRRTESERFSSGDADILVATDAIGMGLNLPIRRVVFSTVHKFDGVQVRPLNTTEVRQIAGRAGRFGLYLEGRVTAFDGADRKHVEQTLAEPLPETLGKLPIAPNLWHIQTLAQVLRTNSIGAVLTFFATRIAVDSPLFTTAALQDTMALGHLVDELAPYLSLEEKHVFSCAPVTADREEEREFFEQCLQRYVSGRKMALPAAPSWLGSRYGNHLEDAESLTKSLSLYAWLGFKYPSIFYQADLLPALRSRLSRYIEAALLEQEGFGLTSKEAFAQRRRD